MINKPICHIEVSSLKYKTQNSHTENKMNKGTGGNGITGTLVVWQWPHCHGHWRAPGLSLTSSTRLSESYTAVFHKIILHLERHWEKNLKKPLFSGFLIKRERKRQRCCEVASTEGRLTGFASECVYVCVCTPLTLPPTLSLLLYISALPLSPLMELKTLSLCILPLPMRAEESFRKVEVIELLYISAPTVSGFPHRETRMR